MKFWCGHIRRELLDGNYALDRGERRLKDMSQRFPEFITGSVTSPAIGDSVDGAIYAECDKFLGQIGKEEHALSNASFSSPRLSSPTEYSAALVEKVRTRNKSYARAPRFPPPHPPVPCGDTNSDDRRGRLGDFKPVEQAPIIMSSAEAESLFMSKFGGNSWDPDRVIPTSVTTDKETDTVGDRAISLNSMKLREIVKSLQREMFELWRDQTGKERLWRDQTEDTPQMNATKDEFPYARIWRTHPIHMLDILEDGLPPDERAAKTPKMQLEVKIKGLHHLPQPKPGVSAVFEYGITGSKGRPSLVSSSEVRRNTSNGNRLCSDPYVVMSFFEQVEVTKLCDKCDRNKQ